MKSNNIESNINNSTALQVFNFNSDRPVRVVMDDQGEPWFVGKDVAEILGYANTRKALGDHCKNAVSGGVTIRDAIGRNQKMTIIPERDLYRLIMKSKLPSAEQFEEWVVGEVLPSIRKHGGYLTPQKIEEALLNPDTLIRLATDLKTERARRIEAERTKAEIGSRREATAMATAAKAVKKAARTEQENVRLKNKLGYGETWKQAKAIHWFREHFELSQGFWSAVGKQLVKLSEAVGYEVKKVPCEKYGTVNAYHKDVIELFQRSVEIHPTLLEKYRKVASYGY